MTTISICTLSYGEKYHKFLPKWINAVSKLNRYPDEIIIAHDITDDRIIKYVESFNNVVTIKINGDYIKTPAFLFNIPISYSKSEWIVRSDVDDRLLPHCLDYIDTCEYDIVCFSHIDSNGDVNLRGLADFSEILHSNILPSSSPFKRWIWEKDKIQDSRWEDWIFWINAYKNGATMMPTKTVDFMYNSNNGISKNISEPEILEAKKIIANIIKNMES